MKKTFQILILGLAFDLINSTLQNTSCQNGYLLFNNSCYFVSTEQLTFFESLNACENDGGSLVSIHSLSENDFIQSKIASRSWIGLKDISNTTFYEWTDGSDFDFENWNIEEPSNVNEDCVSMRNANGRWEGSSCSLTRSYACKAPVTSDEIMMAKNSSIQNNSTIVPTMQTSVNGQPLCADGTCGSNSPVCTGGNCCYCDEHCAEFGDCCDDFMEVCGRKRNHENHCSGSCGQKSAGTCWCDDKCSDFGDCCSDVCTMCGYNCQSASHPEHPTSEPKCADGTCGNNSPVCDGAICCHCDDYCEQFGDCCNDYLEVCRGEMIPEDFSCKGLCGGKASSGCWCDEQCSEFGDCCKDVCDECNYACDTY